MDLKVLYSIVAVVSAHVFAADAAVPQPAFSFKYGNRAVAGGESVQVDSRLKVTVETKAYPQCDAVEWVLWFENPSAEKSDVLSEINDGDFLVPLPPAPPKFVGDISMPGDRAVVTMNGCIGGPDYSVSDLKSASEFAANVRYFHPRCSKEHEVHNLGARPSEGEAPFFVVTQGGQGAVIALGWTGGWRAKFNDCADGVRVEAGLARARFYLEPGEKLRTSRVLVMNYAKGEDSGNKFRRLLRNHFSHVASRPGVREGLFAYELWGGLTSEEMIRRVKTLKKKGLAYEDLWIDAGWYGRATKCDDAYTGDWWPWTGDWTPNPRVHPKGLVDVRDAAKDAGMGMMMWFEPERVGRRTVFAKEHPDLLVGRQLLYYGNERARSLVRDMLADFAGRLGFSCYRQDFNFAPAGIFKENDAKDREGVTEILHVTGMYQMWDELLERCPKLLIDNCSGGGRRIDIETLRRAIPFFRSDYQCGFNANADVLQVHNVGLSRLLPYNGCTTKLSDEYSIRSAYSSSHGVAYWNAVFQDEAKVDWAAAKKCCCEYRRIRKYFPCDFYNHGSAVLDDTAWAIWQYHDPSANEGVVMAFRRAASPSDRVAIQLRGLSPSAAVEVENLDTGEKSSVRGRLEIVLPKRRTSTVLVYRFASSAKPWLKGATDKDPLSYSVGEEIAFTVAVQEAAALPPGLKLRWERTGDDGRIEKGVSDAASPLLVKTSLNRPGFVRLYAEVCDEDGKPWEVEDAKGLKSKVFFDGGAAVEPRKLRQTKAEPKDFETFWAKRKAELAAVPMSADIEEIDSPTPGAKLYKVSVACAGPRPATGYLSVPAAEGKYPASVFFFGYNASWGTRATNPPNQVPTNVVRLALSAHGFEMGRDAAYYRDFKKSVSSNGYGHAFDPVQNARPETCYFGGMAWRVMRGIEYVKSRPEWNGRDLELTGGSQGSLQAMWGAALVPGVTVAKIFIPWFCDVGGTEDGRNHGDWYPKWAPGLDYYDQVNIARLVPKSCSVEIFRAGLGDYIAPPCGVAIMFNNLSCPKKIVWVQGSTHGYVPPCPQSVEWRQ